MDSNDNLMLGFVEEKPSDEFLRENFRSQVGGYPIWLPGRNALSSDMATCEMCHKPMSLLVQLYAPEDHIPEAFHRYIYVFICKNGPCHQYNWRYCYKVYRSQISDCSDSLLNSFSAQSLCAICGFLGNKQCSKCKRVRYCSREHQLIDWKSGHSNECGLSSSYQGTKTKCSFPLKEIVSEPEDYQEKSDIEFGDKKNAVVPLNISPDPEIDTSFSQAEFEESSVDVDKAFLKFQKRIRHDPDQILRYCRTMIDENPGALWVSEQDKPELSDIPLCKCGEERTLEFQILPQILQHLSINHSDPNAIDFGTLLVYSCPKSCLSATEYSEEFIWHQPFSQDGLSFQEKKKRFGLHDK